MKGWLVVNHFLTSDKFNEISEWLKSASKRHGLDLIRKTNVELMGCVNEETNYKDMLNKPDFILFWDKDIPLASLLEKKGFRLFNSSRAIEKCDDKSLTYLNLLGSGLKIPRTIISPKIFDPVDFGKYDFTHRIISELGLPLVIKECFGSFGQQVYLANNHEELIKIMNNIGAKPMLFQEFIASSKGRDIRINIVGGEPVACMYRYSDNDDFRANISNGAKMKIYTPNNAQVQMAVKACEKLKLDFAGVDILFGQNDEPVLCEVNSNAHFKNIYDCTGVNVADFIVKHIIKKMKNLTL